MKAQLTLLVIFIAGLCLAQAPAPPKTLLVSKAASEIKIDGKLTEADWSLAESATDFMNFEPVPWEKPSQRTEVKVLYDNEAIYIGAFMWDEDPEGILKQYSLRDDDRANTDQFTVIIDTYQSQQTASAFAVTAAGVQYDAQVFSQHESSRSWDKVWDAVWESDLSFDNKGWYVEMKIPYSALRFPKVDVQTWNINFMREIRRNREQAAWNHIDPEVGGQLIQLGQVTGLENVEPPIRLSFTPYLAGVLKNNYNKTANPVSDWNSEFGGGLDVKYGINEAFTLDMTLIPDFSEVQSDDAVLNLGPFEVAFDEYRPFFTEGTELFNKSHLFYTRRIGDRPKFLGQINESLGENEEVTRSDNLAQLINATKLSGRNENGLGIGVFNAIEGETYATIYNSETEKSERIIAGPLSNYNILVFDQILKNSGNVYAMNTNVWRSGEFYDANVSAGGFRLRNDHQTFEVEGFGSLSQIYEPGDTDLGHYYSFALRKVAGNWTGNVAGRVISDNYKPNDLGLLFRPNERSATAQINYNDYDGFGVIAAAGGYINAQYTRIFDPDVFADFAINYQAFARNRNFDAFGFWGRFEPVETYDYFDPRTSDFSRYLPYPVNFMITGFVSTDYRKPFAVDVRLGTRRWYTTKDRSQLIIEFEPRFRFSDRFSVIAGINFQGFKSDRGYATTTENSEIIMGDRDRAIHVNSINANYIFNENIGLALRIRHYWSTVEYQRYFELNEDSELVTTNYTGLDPDGESIHDISQSFFNLDCVLRWRFAPGSDLLFTWKTAISPSDGLIDDSYWQETGSLLDSPIRNSFTLKVLYFHDWARMREIWK